MLLLLLLVCCLLHGPAQCPQPQGKDPFGLPENASGDQNVQFLNRTGLFRAYFRGSERDMGREWKAFIWPRIRDANFDFTLEVAPGAGRNTARLRPLVRRLIGVDLDTFAIARCKKRFADDPRLQFFVNDGKNLPMVPSAAVTFIYSWDAMVHFHPKVLWSYVQVRACVLARVLLIWCVLYCMLCVDRVCRARARTCIRGVWSCVYLCLCTRVPALPCVCMPPRGVVCSGVGTHLGTDVCLGGVVCCGHGTRWGADFPAAALSLRMPIFCSLRTALKDSPQGPPTANRRQPPMADCQPPTATNRQPPPTANQLFLWCCVFPMSWP